MKPHQAEKQKQWVKIVAKTWADDDYKAQLLADPKAVLAKEGVELGEGLQHRVVEAAENQVVLVLPPKSRAQGSPAEGEERLAAWFFGDPVN